VIGRPRDLYLIIHDTYKREASIYPAGFELTIPESEQP